MLAHAMHETGFGTSCISRRFHNLFGWNAADRNPTGLATRFRTYSASIDYVAIQISERYLTPGGQLYGGRPTLRGMRYYATDPLWGPLISHIANGIVLSTLSGRNITFEKPLMGDASTGQPVEVTITASAGELPDGLPAAYRFVPVAVVEAGSPGDTVPPLDPVFRSSEGTSLDNRLEIIVEAPERPGRYRLEVELRDSDGTTLTEYDVPEIPAAGIRVYGSDAVSFELQQDPAGLAVVVTNAGRRVIPMVGTIPAGSALPTDGSTGPAPPPTTLTAWLVGADGTPSLLSTIPLDRDIQPGDTWTARLPAPEKASLPAVLLLRLDVGGEPGRLGGAPPGVFVVAAASVADPSTRLPPAPRGLRPPRTRCRRSECHTGRPGDRAGDRRPYAGRRRLTPPAESRLAAARRDDEDVRWRLARQGLARNQRRAAHGPAVVHRRRAAEAAGQRHDQDHQQRRRDPRGERRAARRGSPGRSGHRPGRGGGRRCDATGESIHGPSDGARRRDAWTRSNGRSGRHRGIAAGGARGRGRCRPPGHGRARLGARDQSNRVHAPDPQHRSGSPIGHRCDTAAFRGRSTSYLVLARVLPGNGDPPLPATMFWLRGAPPIVDPDALGTQAQDAQAQDAQAQDAQAQDDSAADTEASGGQVPGADPTTLTVIPLGAAGGTGRGVVPFIRSVRIVRSRVWRRPGGDPRSRTDRGGRTDRSGSTGRGSHGNHGAGRLLAP